MYVDKRKVHRELPRHLGKRKVQGATQAPGPNGLDLDKRKIHRELPRHLGKRKIHRELPRHLGKKRLGFGQENKYTGNNSNGPF